MIIEGSAYYDVEDKEYFLFCKFLPRKDNRYRNVS
ncbi:hypothetical protein ANCDUO_17280 [Ancylostoma duodenale]|uniref:Uncharacterized protein n=1 Tax=Ancylostoma duodenale TaxID=51022 RepID=A0A0C2G6B2_9BILA|nr:hypothetical protein ANCDUO_17280 [Ancylostoma duodenale]